MQEAGWLQKAKGQSVLYNRRKIAVSNLAVKDSNRDLTQLVRNLAALQDGPFLALLHSPKLSNTQYDEYDSKDPLSPLTSFN